MVDFLIILKWIDSAGRKKIFYQVFDTAYAAEHTRDTYATLLNRMVEYGTIQKYSIDIR